jgi:outer membrane protein assembly factor BamB
MMSTTTSWGLCLMLGLLLPRLAAMQAPAGQPVPPPGEYAAAWTVAFDAAVPVFVTASPTVVVVSGPATPATGRALEDGEVVWTTDDAVSDVVPVAGDDLVFLASATRFEARDAATGAARWTATLQAPVARTPAWVPGGLVVATRAGLEAYRTNGAGAWQLPLTGIATDPVIAQGTIVVGLESQEIVALALADGTERWRATLTGRPMALSAGGDRVYATAADGAWFAYDLTDGSRQWRFPTRVSAVGPPLVGDDLVYLVLLDNTVQAFDRGSGNRRWIAPLANRPSAGPHLGADAVVVPVSDGGVLAVPLATEAHEPGRLFDLPDDVTGAAFESAAVSRDGAMVFVLTSSLEAPGFRLTALRRGADRD